LCLNTHDALTASPKLMPTRDLVQRLIGMVEAGCFVEAMKAFYADDDSMQQNNEAPRQGLPALIQERSYDPAQLSAA